MDQEVWQVQLLLRGLRVDPLPQVTRGRVPEPDVLVWPQDIHSPIGVEVTHIHPLGHERRHREGERRSILEFAKTLYLQSGHPPAFVSVIWSEYAAPTKASRQRIATELVATVADHVPPEVGRYVIDPNEDDSAMLPSGIDRITIDRFEGVATCFTSPEAVFVPDIGRAHIEEAFRRKNGKVANYKDDYAQRWLLLVAGGAGPSTWGTITDELQSHTFDSAFDQAFILNSLQLGVCSLRVSRLESAT